MATYYLFQNDTYLSIGETSFKKFYTDIGWGVLLYLIEKNEIVTLNDITIIRDTDNVKLTIEDFLDEIKKMKIILDND